MWGRVRCIWQIYICSMASVFITKFLYLLSVSVPPPKPLPSSREMWWEDVLNHSSQPAHPRVSEKMARQALLEHVKNHWCYGEGAAKNMAITKLKYSSAFHVSDSLYISLSLLKIAIYSSLLIVF